MKLYFSFVQCVYNEMYLGAASARNKCKDHQLENWNNLCYVAFPCENVSSLSIYLNIAWK
jgi:hypothetical protein